MLVLLELFFASSGTVLSPSRLDCLMPWIVYRDLSSSLSHPSSTITSSWITVKLPFSNTIFWWWAELVVEEPCREIFMDSKFEPRLEAHAPEALVVPLLVKSFTLELTELICFPVGDSD